MFHIVYYFILFTSQIVGRDGEREDESLGKTFFKFVKIKLSQNIYIIISLKRSKSVYPIMKSS